VINAANDALDEYLRIEKNLHVPVRVEKWMGILFQKNPTKYAPPIFDESTTTLLDSSPKTTTPTTPVYLTLLRKDAIHQILIENQKTTTTSHVVDEQQQQVHDAFQVWCQARHDAIPQYMAKNVTAYLKKIKSLSTSKGTSLVVGAITDVRIHI